MDPAYSAQQATSHVVAHNLREYRARVAAAAVKSGRSDASVRLVAVSKTKPMADILIAYEQGHRHFGENVQELVEKAEKMPKDIQWHFIGTLQSNKCKFIAAIPNLYAVETVDGAKKADTLEKAVAPFLATARENVPLGIFVQVNTSGEESKSGISPADAVPVAKHILEKCPSLRLAGFMTIGSPDRDPTQGPNPDFQCLNECCDAVLAATELTDLELSMGMSDDFEHAIEMGATNVRLGSCIFGARAKKV
ncbi:hypothetical protein BC830DRAFT_1060456 [Chytriomyces sp. MP71]|nr:hypothetical protein BC830DRAFT_1060456 [Chytriomyces sp. MP71]